MNAYQTLQLAVSQHQAGNLAEAETLYRQVLAAEPNNTDAIHLLGVLAQQNGRLADAEKLIGQAIRLAPATPEFHVNMGRVLADQNRLDLAVSAFRHALKLRPRDAETHNNLGAVLQKQERIAEATAEFQTVLKIAPRHAAAMIALAGIVADAARWDEAIALCRAALAIEPDNADAHLNLAVLLLRSGDFAHGWSEYEWRWKVAGLEVGPLTSAQPPWNGGELAGKRIVLHTEQGLGDTIQMARFAPLVRRRGGYTILYCQPELTRLLKTVPEVDEVIAWGKLPPPCDEHCPMISLPRAFKTDLTNIPANVPYVSADPERSRKWRDRIGEDKRLKVGLAWAGSANHARDLQRSLPLSRFAPLAARTDVRFFSLQKGNAAEQARSAPFELTDWTDELSDFADTAALVENLDLVITVDSAVAHLCGALGRKVWVLIPWIPDWRWLLDRADSPWYPTLRLFRQKKRDDWDAPLAEMAEAMRIL